MPCAKSCLRLPLFVSLLTCFSSLSNSGLEYREKFSEPPVFRHISQPGPGSPMGERYSVCTIMSKVPFFSSSMRSARSITRILVSMPSVRLQLVLEGGGQDLGVGRDRGRHEVDVLDAVGQAGGGHQLLRLGEVGGLVRAIPGQLLQLRQGAGELAGVGHPAREHDRLLGAERLDQVLPAHRQVDGAPHPRDR